MQFTSNKILCTITKLLPHVVFTDAAAGGSDDYMKGVAGIELSYTLEFTKTIYGFLLPASQIQPTVSRFFPAIRVFGEYVKKTINIETLFSEM